jgi:hypothetical protein
MKYLCNRALPSGVNDWREMFDFVMTSAGKPRWYTQNQPFRLLDVDNKTVRLNEVNSLKRGEVYAEGSLAVKSHFLFFFLFLFFDLHLMVPITQKKEFTRIAAQKGNRVLYFGDHVFHDLKEPNVIEGWKTGVIIRELEREVEIQTSQDYQSRLVILLAVNFAVSSFLTL